MKTIKPQRLGVIHKVFEDDDDCYLVVTTFAFFSYAPGLALLSEVDMWRFVPGELGKEGVLDMAMPKPRGEVIVTGKAYPRGRPQPACAVRVKIGAVDKTLWAAGDRQWHRGAATDPVPFDEMPLRWERAFGGEGHPENPVGKGMPDRKGEAPQPLPNVEDPRRLVRSPDDRPAPAGFGPYDLTWPQRFSKVGTYDRRWLEERFPSYAEDMDMGIFNAAPDDQQIDGYFRGDEPFTLENMHPERPVIEAALPALAARTFINQRTPAGAAFREVPMHLDTVHLFPHAERGVLVYRGLATVAEDDAADVLQLVVAAEALGAPKPEQHYRDVLGQRLDEKRAHLFFLRDKDLLPEVLPGGVPPRATTDMDELVAFDNLTQKKMTAGARRKTEQRRQEALAYLTSRGLDPATFGVSTTPAPEAQDPEIPALDDLAPFVEELEARMEREEVEAKEKRAKAEADARAAYEKVGLGYDALTESAQAKAGGPPKVTAAGQRERLEGMATLLRNAGYPNAELEEQLADPEIDRLFQIQEEQAREGYRLTAHLGPPASRLTGEPALRMREEVMEAHRARRSLAGRDLTGADLAGLDLRGVDLDGAQLEKADLAGADLRDANLRGAVLARADLTGAKLEGARLESANLGLATLVGADLSRADASEAVFYKADLAGACFRGADLTLADLSEAVFRDNDLSGASAQLLTLIRVDLSGARLAGADLCRGTFIECGFAGADFTGARLVSTAFFGGSARGAVFRGAVCEKLRVVQAATFDDADFQGATLTSANLRGASLSGAVFAEAKMNGADLSGCDLRGARMTAVVAREARLVRADLRGADLRDADLMLAVLQKAKLAGADLTRANLFRADLAKAVGDEHTVLSDANVTQARVVQRRPREQG